MALSLLEEANELFLEKRFEEAANCFEILLESGGEAEVYRESPLLLMNLGIC